MFVNFITLEKSPKFYHFGKVSKIEWEMQPHAVVLTVAPTFMFVFVFVFFLFVFVIVFEFCSYSCSNLPTSCLMSTSLHLQACLGWREKQVEQNTITSHFAETKLGKALIVCLGWRQKNCKSWTEHLNITHLTCRDTVRKSLSGFFLQKFRKVLPLSVHIHPETGWQLSG